MIKVISQFKFWVMVCGEAVLPLGGEIWAVLCGGSSGYLCGFKFFRGVDFMGEREPLLSKIIQIVLGFTGRDS